MGGVEKVLGAALLAALTLSACGYTTGGEGSLTLEVIAAGTIATDENVTHFVVRVFDTAGDPVDDAEVTVTQGGRISGTTLSSEGDGVYRGEVTDLVERVELAVETPGGDFVTGRLEGPSAHTIQQPIGRVAHPIHQDLPVAWATRDGLAADHVVITLSPLDFPDGEFSTVVVNDEGAYFVPQTFLRAGQSRLQIARTNAVPLAGGLRASSLSLAFAATRNVTITSNR